MVTVELRNLILHGYHGVFEEEKKVMNTFDVSLSVKYDERRSDFNSLDETISYVDLYDIVRQKIKTPVFLLEKICQEIVNAIRHRYPSVRKIKISIYKMQAPIENFQGRVGVTMRRKFGN